MNPTTSQNNSQGQPGDNQLNPDQLAATLAHATNLHEASLPQEPEAHVASQEAPGQAQPQETTNEAPQEKQPQEEAHKADAKMTKLELDMTQKIDDLRKELDDKHKLELDNLKNEIKQALEDEQGQ